MRTTTRSTGGPIRLRRAQGREEVRTNLSPTIASSFRESAGVVSLKNRRDKESLREQDQLNGLALSEEEERTLLRHQARRTFVRTFW